MYGWRGRIGLLVPSSNTTMESEFQKMLPEGISLHTSRMMQTTETEEDLMQMAEYAKRAAREVATADVNVIIYGCTSGSFLKGEKWNEELTKELNKIAGKPVITTATAVKQALDTLKINKLFLITPYPEETKQREKMWLESLGFKVVKIIELIRSTYSQPIENLEIGRIMPQLVYVEVKRNYPPGTNGMFISCTNLRTIEIIDILEEDFGVPVVTSNQASMWAALRRVKYKGSINGFGKLLKQY